MMDLNSGEILIEVNPEFYRPNEVELLIGDASKAKNELGWEQKISFDNLANRMISSDLNELGINIKSFRTTQIVRRAFAEANGKGAC